MLSSSCNLCVSCANFLYQVDVVFEWSAMAVLVAECTLRSNVGINIEVIRSVYKVPRMEFLPLF